MKTEAQRAELIVLQAALRRASKRVNYLTRQIKRGKGDDLTQSMLKTSMDVRSHIAARCRALGSQCKP